MVGGVGGQFVLELTVLREPVGIRGVQGRDDLIHHGVRAREVDVAQKVLEPRR